MSPLETKIQQLQQDLIELQIQFTHQNQTIRQLDEVIQEQYKEIDALKEQNQSILKLLESVQSAPISGSYERPPHY